MNALRLLSIFLLSFAPLVAQQPDTPQEAGKKRLFAAVYLVRGSVSGGNVGSYGVFVRQDTGWQKLTKSNVISSAVGYTRNGTSLRYYLAAGNGIHLSTDGGAFWKIMTSWKITEVTDIVPDPEDPMVVYASSAYGVYKSTDGALTWSKHNEGMKKWYVRRVRFDVRDHSTLYAVCEDDLYRSTDGGVTWKPLGVHSYQPVGFVQDPKDPAALFVGVEDGGIHRSLDGGKTWVECTLLPDQSMYNLAFSADGKDLYAGGFRTGLWRSTDRGDSWERVWSDDQVEAVYSLLVDPSDPSHVVIGTNGWGVFESHDRCATWKQAGLYGGQIKDLKLMP